MEIKKNKDGEKLTVALFGRLDTNTAPELQNSLEQEIADIKQLYFDMAELEYLSSAGLRVLLFLHKKCAAQGASMSLFNCNDMTMDVFKMTGFDGFLDIK